jgi:hypothetical protein
MGVKQLRRQHLLQTAPRRIQLTLITDRNSEESGERFSPGVRVSRQMVWRKTPQLEAWTCVRCAWAFLPSGPPLGDSLDEMMLNYELQRDKEYACHVCAQYPKAKSLGDNSTFSGRLGYRPQSSMLPDPRGSTDTGGAL